MSLGVAIFAASIVISFVALFIATKDRWNWKKIIARGAVVGIGTALVLGLLAWGYAWLSSRPRAQTAFWDVQLGAPESDVLFLKGRPSKIASADLWMYSQGHEASYVVKFRGGVVSAVGYSGGYYGDNAPQLQGVSQAASYQYILDRFGRPSEVTPDTSGISRKLFYENYNLFFFLEAGKLKTYGIYDHATHGAR